jgi:hypothetical protein
MMEAKHIRKILERQYPDSAWWKTHPYWKVFDNLWAEYEGKSPEPKESGSKGTPGG